MAVARAAGILDRLDRLLRAVGAVPLLARVYPNGSADVNQFQAAGGPGYVIRELLDAGLMHEDVLAVGGDSLRAYTRVPARVATNGSVERDDPPATSSDDGVLRPATAPFSTSGGLKLLTGNLGRAVIKVSAVPEDRHIVEARRASSPRRKPCWQPSRPASWSKTSVVVRFQGPKPNGMPELHKLTPPRVPTDNGFKASRW